MARLSLLPLAPAADPQPPVKISALGVSAWYGAVRALEGVSLEIPANRVTALIGPSGCGKTTFLRCLNRMNDTIEGARVEGSIVLDGKDIHD